MDDFLNRVESRDVRVGVVGLGYVGLPLSVAFAEAGFPTVGFDADADRTAQLMTGVSHVEDVAGARIASVVAEGRYLASADPADLARADGIFICVPTPFDVAKSPDLSYVVAAATTVGSVLRPGMLVVLQSTTYPGTTTEVVQPLLEASGLKAGEDFLLAFSPERVDPGNTTWTVKNTPKVVGSTSEAGSRHAAALLESVMDSTGLVTILSSPEAAEMTKLLENTYRAVNIALVNELAILAHEIGIDIWEVIAGAGTKPFGFQAFNPGIGPGGHCIPVDPYYLSWRARQFDFQTKFIELAADTNLGMAPYVRARIQDFLNVRGRALAGSRILAIGAAFKPGVSDIRNSRALHVIGLLRAAGADVRYADPHVPSLTIDGERLEAVEITPELLDDLDLVVVLVDHAECPIGPVLAARVPVFDAVNATKGAERADLERL
jgi:UDP-N-acetyl-D-glucosamine dehydrogenase